MTLFARSETWLFKVGILESSNRAVSLGNLFRILLGLWICHCASRRTVISSNLREVMIHVEERLECEEKEGSFDPFSHDAKLLLLCYNMLSAYGYSVYGIEHFAQQVAEALKKLPTLPLRYIGEALLLTQLGYNEPPQVPKLQADKAGGDAFQLIRADEEKIRSVCGNICAATLFGSKPLQADVGVIDYLERILPIIFLQSLRDYKLEMGSLLLRTNYYLNRHQTQAFYLAILFLMHQQQSDGKFGYFAIETEELSKTQRTNDFDATISLYLPVTVSCLWSLAEILTPKFNLFTFSKLLYK